METTPSFDPPTGPTEYGPSSRTSIRPKRARKSWLEPESTTSEARATTASSFSDKISPLSKRLPSPPKPPPRTWSPTCRISPMRVWSILSERSLNPINPSKAALNKLNFKSSSSSSSAELLTVFLFRLLTPADKLLPTSSILKKIMSPLRKRRLLNPRLRKHPKRRKERKRVRRMRRRRKKLPLSRWRQDLTTELSILEPLASRPSSGLSQQSANSTDNSTLKTISSKSTPPSCSLDLPKVDLTFSTSNISAGKDAWPNHPSSTSKCVWWLTSRESLRLPQCSEPKTPSPIVICANLLVSIWKWPSRSTTSKSWNTSENSCLSCSNNWLWDMLMSWKLLTSNILSLLLSASTQSSKSPSKKESNFWKKMAFNGLLMRTSILWSRESLVNAVILI